MSGELAGKNAIVAGTGPNIGTGIALALAAEGARVWALDRDADSARCCSEAVVAAGGEAAPLVADATDGDQVEAAVAKASSSGPVDVLVNGIASYNEKGLLKIELAEWTQQINLILGSAFLLTRAVTRRLVDSSTRGSVTLLGSTAAHQGQPGNIAYCTAKAGLLNFVRSAAMELAPFGIRVNTLTPTATALDEVTERAPQWGVDRPSADALARKSRSRSMVPLGRLPSPREYGRAAVFLASDGSASITGIDLPIDGGALARYWAFRPTPEP